MRFRVIVKVGVFLSVLLFCAGVGFYSFVSLSEADKRNDFNMYSIIPDDCFGVLETDNIDYFTNEFPRTAYAGALDTLRHIGLINSILNDLTQYTSINSHGINNQMRRIMISFHNPVVAKEVVAYFKVGSSGKQFIIDILRQKYGASISSRIEEYRGRNIEIYPLGKTTKFLSVLTGEGYIAISYHKRLIERVIDAIKDGTSLANNDVFSKIDVKKSANYMTFYGHGSSFPLLSDGHGHSWSEYDLHMNSDVLYLSGSMYEPDSCFNNMVSRMNNIQPISEDSLLIISGNNKIDSCISKAMTMPRNSIFDECVSNLSRDASYIMVIDMEKAARELKFFRPYLPGFICDNIELFKDFIVSLQITEVNGRLSHIYVFTYKY